MKIALTTNARLFKDEQGAYYTQSVYDYQFFTRYLNSFEQIKLIAHTEKASNDKVKNMVRVNGPGVEVFEVPFPHGKVQYVMQYKKIKKALKNACADCNAAILRIPDQLAFQLYKEIKGKMPIAVEVTSDPWLLFSPKNYKKSILRGFIRLNWHINQKRICKQVLGTSYVTKNYIQQRYPYSGKPGYFTTYYTDTDIDENWLKPVDRIESEQVSLIHVSTAINGNAKGHKELLIAAGELIKKGYKIQVVLVGSGELNEENKNIVASYGIESCIRKTGSLTRDALLDELRKADIFVFPSYVEGLPRVVVEAMGTGLSCVATDLPGIRELLDRDCLVPVKDVELLQIKIEKLLDKTARDVQSVKNRLVASEYSITRIKEKREEFYKKLKHFAQKEEERC